MAAKEHEEHGHREKEVEVFINGHEKKIPAGTYKVRKLKEELGVPEDQGLAEIRGKETLPLKDDEEVKVHGGEKFVSHKRRGGSS
ncbi:hypothetical protein KGM48_02825 [Patescibacteria group bacterium]|nr:hypothetical protein [Patescibacteria group bacterium]